MTTKDYSLEKAENAEEICLRVREEAADEARDILEAAGKEHQRLLDEARKEVFKKKSELLKNADKEIERIRDKVYSMLHLEKKRVILEEKNKFAEEVIRKVKIEAQNFRSASGYPAFLKKSIIEGSSIVGGADNIEVVYSVKDASIINSGFIKDAQGAAAAKFSQPIRIDFKKDDFEDIGVIVRTVNGRLVYDNRFSARLKRMYDDVYMGLLKEG